MSRPSIVVFMKGLMRWSRLCVASQNCCRRKGVRAGLDRNPDRQASVQICSKCARIFRHRCEVFLPPDRNDLKPLAIHGDLDLMGIFHAP